MGTRDRTRPDTAGVPGYITAEGYRRLEEEASHLWNVERPKLAKAVAVAAAEGDRSENAEYIYGKKKLREVDARLQFLGKRLKALTVVSEKPASDGRVYFGSYVELEDEDGSAIVYRLVGPDETDAEKRFISVDSPMGRALLRKHEGDEVLVKRPKGDATFVIVRVLNDPPPTSGR